MLHTTTMEDILYKLDKENPDQNYQITNLDFLIPMNSHEPFSLKARKQAEEWALNIEHVSNNNKTGDGPTIEFLAHRRPGFFHSLIKFPHYFRKKVALFSLDQAKIRMKGVCQEIDRRLISMEAAYDQKRLIFLIRWFRREFGLLTAGISGRQGHNRTNPLKQVCDGISKELNQLLTASQTNIFQYNYEKEIMEVIGEHAADPGRKINITQLMKGIEGYPEKQEKSIVYRTILDNRPHFCRARLIEGEQSDFDPAEETFVPDPDGYASAVITAPFKVLGRNFGVLETAGFSPYQFRWENRQLLCRINAMVSPLLYEALILYSLSELTRKVINITQDESRKFHQICEEMRVLFMAYAAVLWQPDREAENKYRPCGWTKNRDDLERLTLEKPRSVLFDIEDPDCFYRQAFPDKSDKIGPIFNTISITDLIQNDKWVGHMPHRQWLHDKGIKEVSVVPIQGPLEENFLVLILYFRKEGQGLNQDWAPVVEFIAYHTALLLEALYAQIRLEDHGISIINHELKQKVDVILSRADYIYQYLYKQAPRYISDMVIGEMGKKSKMSLVFQDLRSYTASLRGLMITLQDKTALDKLRHQGTHPLHYLALEQVHKWASQEVEKKPVNLRAMYNEVFRPSLVKRNQKKLRTLDNNVDFSIELTIIPEHLRTILNNLVDNAVKYALPDTNIVVESKVRKYSVTFSITNLGQALTQPEKEQYLLFNEAFRGSNADDEGLGQGLFIARLICEINGGELAVEIKPLDGKRSYYTFTVFFPRRMLFSESKLEEAT